MSPAVDVIRWKLNDLFNSNWHVARAPTIQLFMSLPPSESHRGEFASTSKTELSMTHL